MTKNHAIGRDPNAWVYMLSAAICRQAADDYTIGHDCTGVVLFFRGNLFAAMAPHTDPEAVIAYLQRKRTSFVEKNQQRIIALRAELDRQKKEGRKYGE